MTEILQEKSNKKLRLDTQKKSWFDNFWLELIFVALKQKQPWNYQKETEKKNVYFILGGCRVSVWEQHIFSESGRKYTVKLARAKLPAKAAGKLIRR